MATAQTIATTEKCRACKKPAQCDGQHVGDFCNCRVHDQAIHQNVEPTQVGESNCGCEYGKCGCVMVGLENWRVFNPWPEFCIELPDTCTEPPALPVLPDLPALIWPAFSCPPLQEHPCFVAPPRTPEPTFCPDVPAPECAPEIPPEPTQPECPPIVEPEIVIPELPCPGDGEIICSEFNIEW